MGHVAAQREAQAVLKGACVGDREELSGDMCLSCKLGHDPCHAQAYFW